MYLKIIKNEIVVIAPMWITIQKIEIFVNQHIHKFVKYLHEKEFKKVIDYQKKYVYIFGEKINFKVLTGFLKPNVKVVDNLLYLNLQNGDDQEIKKFLQNYLKVTLMQHLLKRLVYFQKMMETFNHQCRVVNKQTSWGSNNVNKKNLSFALKLIHHDSATIDYVIVHELAHDFEPNHSVKFWKIVKHYYPNFLHINKQLKNRND